MKKTACIPYLCAGALFASSLYADTFDPGSDRMDDRDIQALREWINTKRQVTVKEKGGALSISGEVRGEMQAVYETIKGVEQRGARSPAHVPHETFDVEVNLMFDYRTEFSWAATRIKFDNNAGIFGGTFDKLKVDRAYFGVRMYKGDKVTFDVEIGRRRINTFADSKIEGDAFFDGILFRYDQGFTDLGTLFGRLGTFVIDERKYQYGYLGELGFLDIANTGIYAKYLFIDWDTKNLHNKAKNQRFQFITSQVILGYKFVPKKFDQAIVIYTSGLYNHAAHKVKQTGRKRANWASVTGILAGELRKKGDWSLDTSYQFVAAQAVPDYDSAGIGLGNAIGSGFYTVNANGSGGPSTRKTAGGNVNFRGYNVTFQYLLSNTLILFQSWSQTCTLDSSIGPFRRYKQYELEFNYAF